MATSGKNIYEGKDFSGGLNANTRPHLIKENEVQEVENINFLPGKAFTCTGYSKISDLQSDKQYTFSRRNGTVQKLDQVGDKLYVDGILKKSDINGLLSFSTFQDMVFCINENESFIWDGSFVQDWGVEKPTSACTAAVSTTAGNPAEARIYYVTFINARGQESNPSPGSNSVTPVSKQVNLTNIPTGGTNVVKRKIYANATIGSTTGTYEVGEIADNTTTTFTDNISGSVLIIGDVIQTDNDPPPKAKYIVQHKNMLFLGNGSDLVWSKLNTPESFPITNFVTCNDSGDKITGLKVINDWIIIIKERSIMMLNCDGETTNWTLKTLNAERGCAYPDSIQVLNDTIVFLGDDSNYTRDLYEIKPNYSLILTGNEVSIKPIGERVRPLLTGDSSPISADFDGKYWLKIGSKIIVYDYKYDNFTKYKYPDIPISFHVTPDYKLYLGTASGVMESGGNTFNGTAIQSFFVSRDIDMGRRSQKKKIKSIYSYYKKQGVGKKFYIQLGSDEIGYLEPMYVENEDGYMVWGSGLWGQLWGGLDTAGQQRNVFSERNNYFRVKVGSSTNNFEFYGYGIVYRLKSVR